MYLSRRGIFRDHGPSTLFNHDDAVTIEFSRFANAGERVVVRVNAPRSDESSYDYRLNLSPEDVLRCVLSLPGSAAAEAVKNLSEEFNLAEDIPQLVQHLVSGALAVIPDAEAVGVGNAVEENL
jgi:hypothetical protein